ncbi:MAG: RNA polymerase sigma factor [Acidimicrobiales bacterium]
MFQRLIHTLFGPRLGSPASLVLPRLWAAPPGAGDPLEARRGLATDDGDRAPRDRESSDSDKLHELVVEHGDAVYRLALSVVRDRALAEDVAQDTMIKAWLALPSFRGESSLRGWLMRIAHNTAISTLRTRRALVTDPTDLPDEPVRPEQSVEHRVEDRGAMDAFTDALDLLDELSRSIVVLREIERMSYDEIAEILDVPLPTVKTRLLRARRRLGTALEAWK